MIRHKKVGWFREWFRSFQAEFRHRDFLYYGPPNAAYACHERPKHFLIKLYGRILGIKTPMTPSLPLNLGMSYSRSMPEEIEKLAQLHPSTIDTILHLKSDASGRPVCGM